MPVPDMPKLEKIRPPKEENALDTQVGGSHYKRYLIQPVEFCQRNGLGYCESNVVKYVARHKFKNGKEDIKKAIHYLELLLAMEYPTGQNHDEK